jgi:hypothetical protein
MNATILRGAWVKIGRYLLPVVGKILDKKVLAEPILKKKIKTIKNVHNGKEHILLLK